LNRWSGLDADFRRYGSIFRANEYRILVAHTLEKTTEARTLGLQAMIDSYRP